MSPGPENVFGRPQEDLCRWVGSLEQVARVDRLVEEEGSARGTRRIRLVSGSGLEAEVYPDRALDLGQVTYRGIPLAWISPTGMVSPFLVMQSGRGWLRGFGGGLLSTCGLDTFGPATVSGEIEYPMHGRIGAVPACVTRAEVSEGELVVAGTVRQAAVFGEDFILHRTWSMSLGGSTLRLRDTVFNAGRVDSGHMVMYHVNVGWPLLAERAVLEIPSREVTPRDEDARGGATTWHQIEGPQPGFREQVFGHDFGRRGVVRVCIDNPDVDLRFELRVDTSTLPAMHQWKMSGEGHYVMGLEPVNVNSFSGRVGTQAAGVLPVIPAGGRVSYSIDFVFGPSLVRNST